MAQFDIYIDGGSRGNPGEAAYAYVVFDKNGTVVAEAKSYLGMKTNNFAEYAALLAALHWASSSRLAFQTDIVTIHSDSKLVVEQVNGRWEVKEPALRSLWLIADHRLKVLAFEHVGFELLHIPRELNTHADRLVNEILDARSAS